MTQATFFTPSFIGDLDRAVWLRRSLRAFFRGRADHIMAVPHRDLPAFRRAFGHETDLILVAQEDWVDPCFYPDRLHRLVAKLAPSQLWRLKNHAGKPGWIIQQIVKFNSPSLVAEGAVVFLDSDLFFFRPFDFSSLGIDNNRLLVRILPLTESARHRHHIAKAREILALPGNRGTDQTYMGYPAIWYVDWTRQPHDYLERVSGKPWQHALFDAGHISEYTIYGIYLEEVLKPSQLVIRDKKFNFIAWDRDSFSKLKAAMLQPQFPAERISLVIQSNIGIPTSEYEDLLKHILDNSEASTDR